MSHALSNAKKKDDDEKIVAFGMALAPFMENVKLPNIDLSKADLRRVVDLSTAKL